MSDRLRLARRFDSQRARLRAVAYQLLGSASDADDAVQEAWLRVERTDTATIENLDGWLTTVVSRISLDLLRSPHRRRETPWIVEPWNEKAPVSELGNPEREVAQGDAVGVALLVVLETLSPAERLAFVLHDVFGQPFDEIAEVLGRTPAAARQLASRARRRVRDAPSPAPVERRHSRAIVEAWLTAVQKGDLGALVAMLDESVVLRAGYGANGAQSVSGAHNVAERATGFARLASHSTPVLLNRGPGVIAVIDGQILSLMAFEIVEGRITGLEVLADPDRLAKLDLSHILPAGGHRRDPGSS